MTALSFVVVGTPGAQGSKKHVGNGIMVESSAKVKPWRQDVAAAAQAAHHGPPMDGPLAITIVFRFPPTSSWKAADRLRKWRWKDRTPDLDKLCRSTFDALTTAGVIVDDARIVSLNARKIEVVGASGAEITLRSMPPYAEGDAP